MIDTEYDFRLLAFAIQYLRMKNPLGGKNVKRKWGKCAEMWQQILLARRKHVLHFM